MKRARISTVLHVLVHLAQAGRVPLTSEHLAVCLATNPVVIRRNLAALRQAELVDSAPGHGGGWTLARSPEAITLQEVYAAIGERLGSSPEREAFGSGCLLEARVHQALGDVYGEIDALLQERLTRITLADLVRDLPAPEAVSSPRETTQEAPRGV